MKNSRVIVVSNRLPVKVSDESGRMVLKRSEGGLATALGSIMNTRAMLWIGWPGTQTRLTRKQLNGLNFPKMLVPVTFSKRLLEHYYNRLANGVLWPVMHGLKPERKLMKADWEATREVTEKFAEAVQANWKPGDVIWVHDYHLVLLPKALRKQGVEGRVGFFLHTPFPKPEVFMAWKRHRAILESLSSVDVLGFQTARDVRNFRACLEAADLRMRPGAEVRAWPIGVDFGSYRAADKLRDVARLMKRLGGLKQRHEQLVVSVSRLDYTKGIVEQLRAVERVLESQGPGSLRYKLVVAPSRDNLPEYQSLKTEVEQTVREINERFSGEGGDEPVSYEYRSHGFTELNALYRLADVLLVTPVIDGMNLVVKEYIAARGARLGAVVMSHSTGAAFQLRDAVQVAPGEVDDIARGLAHALKMPLVEQARRWQAMYRNVKQQDVFWWTEEFLRALERPVFRPVLLPVPRMPRPARPSVKMASVK